MADDSAALAATEELIAKLEECVAIARAVGSQDVFNAVWNAKYEAATHRYDMLGQMGKSGAGGAHLIYR